MTAKEVSIWLAIAVAGGIVVAIFSYYFLNNPSLQLSVAARSSQIYVSEFHVDHLSETGLIFPDNENGKKPHILIGYRLTTDSKVPLVVKVAANNQSFIGGQYSYGRDSLADGILAESNELKVIPGDFLNIYSFWSLKISSTPAKLYISSDKASIDSFQRTSCALHPYLGKELCN